MDVLAIGGRALVLAVALVGVIGCGDPPASIRNGRVDVTVRFAYRASTTPRTDLPASARECVAGVGRTHIHPSWRSFDRFEMTPNGDNLREIAFNDVPTNVRQSIRVSDGNACDENATGAATRNVFANDVLLVNIVPTAGSGTEPGLAFTRREPSPPEPISSTPGGESVPCRARGSRAGRPQRAAGHAIPAGCC